MYFILLSLKYTVDIELFRNSTKFSLLSGINLKEKSRDTTHNNWQTEEGYGNRKVSCCDVALFSVYHLM